MIEAEKDLYGTSGFAGLHVEIIAREGTTWVSDTRTAYRVSADFFSPVSRTEPAGAATNVSMTSKEFVIFSFVLLGLAAIYCLRRLAKLNLSYRRSRASYFPKRPTRILHLFVLFALVSTATLVLPRANALSASVIAAQRTLDAANIANSALETSIRVSKAATESATLVRRVYTSIYARAQLPSIHTSIYPFICKSTILTSAQTTSQNVWPRINQQLIGN